MHVIHPFFACFDKNRMFYGLALSEALVAYAVSTKMSLAGSNFALHKTDLHICEGRKL